MGMKCAKPFPHDYRMSNDAEEILKKKLPIMDEEVIIGFMDESSPQTTQETIAQPCHLCPP